MESAAAAPPGAGGVVAFPHLAGGEQGALWDPGAPAAFVGLSLTTSQGDLARALLEGIAFEMHRCVEVWQGAGVRIEEIVLAGGLASSFFATLVASVLAVPVRLAGHADASAAGAAMLAGRGACLWDMQAMQMQARRHLGQVFAPDAAAVDQYAHLARRYEELSAAARSYLAAVRLPT
jgi:xylulokinase